MKLGEAVKTLRGWGKIRVGSTRVRSFKDAQKEWERFFAAIPPEQLCMFDFTIRFPPSKSAKAKK